MKKNRPRIVGKKKKQQKQDKAFPINYFSFFAPLGAKYLKKL